MAGKFFCIDFIFFLLSLIDTKEQILALCEWQEIFQKDFAERGVMTNQDILQRFCVAEHRPMSRGLHWTNRQWLPWCIWWGSTQPWNTNLGIIISPNE